MIIVESYIFLFCVLFLISGRKVHQPVRVLEGLRLLRRQLLREEVLRPVPEPALRLSPGMPGNLQ
jgi:hypothetical protein